MAIVEVALNVRVTVQVESDGPMPEVELIRRLKEEARPSLLAAVERKLTADRASHGDWASVEVDEEYAAMVTAVTGVDALVGDVTDLVVVG